MSLLTKVREAERLGRFVSFQRKAAKLYAWAGPGTKACIIKLNLEKRIKNDPVADFYASLAVQVHRNKTLANENRIRLQGELRKARPTSSGLFCDASHIGLDLWVIGFVFVENNKTIDSGIKRVCKVTVQEAESAAIQFAKSKYPDKEVHNDCDAAVREEGAVWIPRRKNKAHPLVHRYKRLQQQQVTPKKLTSDVSSK